MQKISFDAEDFPPPSYYFGDGLDDDDPAISNKAKDVLSPLLQDHSRSDGSGPYHKSTDVAPVHQSSKAVGAGMKDSEKSGTLDKSEWWKAPEFVPRSMTVQLSSNGSYVTQQQQQAVGAVSTASVNHQLGANFISGSSKDLSQIPFQRAVVTPPQQQAPASLTSKQTPIIHPTLTPPVPSPFPIAMPPTGMAPAPAPAFIPLPLPTPAASSGWPMAGAPGPVGAPQLNPALAALHTQLARVYAHNPRVMRGQHPPMPTATAFHHHKLQQLILQQQQQHQQQNQFQQRHPHHRQHQSMLPFAPTNMAQLRGQPTAPGPGIPTGYTANMTTIDAGLGRPIPAIVLKRKRKKKNKKLVDIKQQPQAKQAANIKESPVSDQQPLDNPELTTSTTEIKSEDASGQRSEDDEDDETTSSLTSPHLAETRRSEPDLTKMQHDSAGQAAVCDVLIGTAGEHLVQQSCYYPNDLDLIQSANHCVMITGSCPDLSADTDLIEESMPTNGIMSMSNHINPFLRDDQHLDQEEELQKRDAQQETRGQFFIAKVGDTSLSRSAYGVDEIELDTNPVVRDTMRDLAADGMIKSKQVKELNRQVIKDMRLEQKVKQWKDDDWSDPELDEDDTIFERLLKNEDVRQHSARKQLETNPGKGQKSLKEELEEGLMVFRNRGAKEYGRVPLNEEDAMSKEERNRLLAGGDDDRVPVHHTAIVHGSKRDGEMAKTELFDSDEGYAGSKKHSKHSSLIPRATYVESEVEDEERMRITVNALEALDVDGADTFLAKSHLRSMAAGANHVQSLEDVSTNTASKRRYSFPDSVPLVPLVKSRNCCTVM